MNKIDILAWLEKNNTLVELQMYATSCLRQHCKLKKISHPSLTNLMNHLDSISTTSSLSEWNTRGAQLELNGRGDPPPITLKSSLSPVQIDELCMLVDCVVEVGIMDLYGTKTDLSLKFLGNIIQILEHNTVPLPKPH